MTATPPGPAVSSLSNKCYRLTLSVVVMHHPRNFILGVLLYALEKKHECFEGFGKRRCEVVAEKFMFGSLRCHRAH